MSRKYGMKSGYVEALNIRSGTVTTDGSGSATVNFDESMENAPAVNVTAAAAAGTTIGAPANVPADTTTASGFTLEGEADTTYHYTAIDDSRY